MCCSKQVKILPIPPMKLSKNSQKTHTHPKPFPDNLSVTVKSSSCLKANALGKWGENYCSHEKHELLQLRKSSQQSVCFVLKNLLCFPRPYAHFSLAQFRSFSFQLYTHIKVSRDEGAILMLLDIISHIFMCNFFYKSNMLIV